MRPVHKKHIKTLITGFERELAEKLGQSTPLDYYLRNYLKQHKSIGQNDRLKISDAVYSLVRYKDLLELGRSSKEGWDKRISVLEDNQIPALQKNGSFSQWQRVSVPKF
jgi:16S rRNA (cytosine967-C5)-methyltransferase